MYSSYLMVHDIWFLTKYKVCEYKFNTSDMTNSVEDIHLEDNIPLLHLIQPYNDKNNIKKMESYQSLK